MLILRPMLTIASDHLDVHRFHKMIMFAIDCFIPAGRIVDVRLNKRYINIRGRNLKFLVTATFL